MPMFVLCILRGKSVEWEIHERTVADRHARVTVSFCISVIVSREKVHPSLLRLLYQ